VRGLKLLLADNPKTIFLIIFLVLTPFSSKGSTQRVYGSHVASIEHSVLLTTHNNGDLHAKTEIPRIDGQRLESALTNELSNRICTSTIPVNELRPIWESKDLGERRLFIETRISLQDTLDGVSCKYTEQCVYSTMYFYLRQGSHSGTTLIPMISVFRRTDVANELEEAAVLRFRELLGEIFLCKHDQH
jgi:hypothetical protein